MLLFEWSVKNTRTVPLQSNSLLITIYLSIPKIIIGRIETNINKERKFLEIDETWIKEKAGSEIAREVYQVQGVPINIERRLEYRR